MNDQAITHQLIADVAGVKSDVRNVAEGQSKQWEKLDRCVDALNECNRKLDTLVGHEARLEDVEKGVKDYRTTKNRAVSLVAGLGIGLGGIGGALSAWASRWFNSGG